MVKETLASTRYSEMLPFKFRTSYHSQFILYHKLYTINRALCLCFHTLAMH